MAGERPHRAELRLHILETNLPIRSQRATRAQGKGMNLFSWSIVFRHHLTCVIISVMVKKSERPQPYGPLSKRKLVATQVCSTSKSYATRQNLRSFLYPTMPSISEIACMIQWQSTSKSNDLFVSCCVFIFDVFACGMSTCTVCKYGHFCRNWGNEMLYRAQLLRSVYV